MPLLSRLTGVFTLSALAVLCLPAQAEEARYNQVALGAEVSQEVAHDLMQVGLYSEAQNSDPAALAAEITRTLNRALERARQVQGVTLSLGSRHSYPVYDDKGQQITAWRERAELRLESADFTALSTLTAELLGELKMAGMDFAISKPSRKKSEDALLKDAVEAFKARAQLATDALGGSGYKLVSLNLNSAGFQPPMPMMQRASMKGMAMLEDAPASQIEAGSSQVSVSAEGVIEVQLP